MRLPILIWRADFHPNQGSHSHAGLTRLLPLQISPQNPSEFECPGLGVSPCRSAECWGWEWYRVCWLCRMAAVSGRSACSTHSWLPFSTVSPGMAKEWRLGTSLVSVARDCLAWGGHSREGGEKNRDVSWSCRSGSNARRQHPPCPLQVNGQIPAARTPPALFPALFHPCF